MRITLDIPESLLEEARTVFRVESSTDAVLLSL